MIETVEYRGWKNNLRIANESAELVVTLDVGPRVIAYRKPGGFNVMKNYDEQMGGTGEKAWQIRGGIAVLAGPRGLDPHLLPRQPPRRPREARSDFAARFTPPPEEPYGVQKVMELRLEEKGTRVHVRLRVTNIGQGPTTLAPWGPTVMAPGGVEIIPLPPHANHPGDPKNAKHPGDFAPSQRLVLWPYFDFTDDRWTFGSKYLLLRQDPNEGADEDRPRAPGPVGGVPEPGDAVRQAVPPRRDGDVPGPGDELPDVLQRGHARDGDSRHARDAHPRPERGAGGDVGTLHGRARGQDGGGRRKGDRAFARCGTATAHQFARRPGGAGRTRRSAPWSARPACPWGRRPSSPGTGRRRPRPCPASGPASRSTCPAGP